MKVTITTCKKYSYYLLPILWMGVIYLFSAQSTLPGSEVLLVDFIYKKTGHIVFYMVLFWSWFASLKANKLQVNSWQIWGIIFLLCISYAMFDEYHQSLVPGRSGRWRDVGIDTLGCYLAFLYTYKLI